MPVPASAPRLTEENDARPTYILTGLAFLLLLLDHILQLTSSPHSRSLYVLAVLAAVTAGVSAVYCVIGCIWHPLPKEYRQSGGMTSLTLGAPNAEPASPTCEDDSVDSSQAELRPQLEWKKLLLVLCSAGLMFLLVIRWDH